MQYLQKFTNKTNLTFYYSSKTKTAFSAKKYQMPA